MCADACEESAGVVYTASRAPHWSLVAGSLEKRKDGILDEDAGDVLLGWPSLDHSWADTNWLSRPSPTRPSARRACMVASTSARMVLDAADPRESRVASETMLWRGGAASTAVGAAMGSEERRSREVAGETVHRSCDVMAPTETANEDRNWRNQSDVRGMIWEQGLREEKSGDQKRVTNMRDKTVVVVVA